MAVGLRFAARAAAADRGQLRAVAGLQDVRSAPVRARGWAGRLGLLALVLGLTAITIIGGAQPGRIVAATAHSPLPLVVAAGAPQPTISTAGTFGSNLALGITAAPHAICAFELVSCPAGNPFARVTLSANAGGQGVVAWPAVQVAFVIETTSYDGVYDPTASEPGRDMCAQPIQSTNILCEESNGVPFFIANAQAIANSIQASNPHSQVTFAMVDYFATLTNWDDGDGAEYHVDIQNFIPAADFGAAVYQDFQQSVLGGNWFYSDSDMSDNNFFSSSITAMYGTITGSGLNWANNTHHVIVWMGATAPRDPSYPIDHCVSSENQFYTLIQGEGCVGSTCEPSYHFETGSSPNCEGWVKSQDGNATHSIAALTKTAKSCTGSIGGVCTVDAIDLWTMPTDPYSRGWPTPAVTVISDSGPGSLAVERDAAHVLLAGCDIAAATGGTWNGPAWFSCPDGQAGDLQYVAHGPYDQPVTTNPTLFNAFRQVGFGPVLETQVASGAGKPIFSYVPIGNVALAPNLQPSAACERNGVPFRTCQLSPTTLHMNGVTYLGWNWSTNASSNIMYVGDAWTASFNVIALGPPYTTVPVDACVTIGCKAGGSGEIVGIYSWASYVPASNNSILTESFPLGQVVVEATPAIAPPVSAPPPAPPVPPGIPLPLPGPVPVLQQIGVGQNVGVANVSLQAAAAGFLGAGFMRVGIKNRPIAMRVAAKSGVLRSWFDLDALESESSISHFE